MLTSPYEKEGLFCFGGPSFFKHAPRRNGAREDREDGKKGSFLACRVWERRENLFRKAGRRRRGREGSLFFGEEDEEWSPALAAWRTAQRAVGYSGTGRWRNGKKRKNYAAEKPSPSCKVDNPQVGRS
jgi:hypothetical protein